jgi:hypothetical protein
MLGFPEKIIIKEIHEDAVYFLLVTSAEKVCSEHFKR